MTKNENREPPKRGTGYSETLINDLFLNFNKWAHRWVFKISVESLGSVALHSRVSGNRGWITINDHALVTTLVGVRR